MKNMKKILALLIAVLMVATMIPAMAADEFDAKVSVTGLAAGDVAHFYKVIEWVGETTDDSDVSGWKAVAPFTTILGKDALFAALIGTTQATQADVDKSDSDGITAVGQWIEPTGITAELAGQLARAVGTTAGTEVPVTTDKAELTVDKAGMYMALITPVDADTIYNPVFVSSDYTAGGTNTLAMPALDAASYSDSAAAKKSKVTLEKTADTTEEAWDDGKSHTTAVGDTVTFTVVTTVPGYAGVYEHPYFELSDTLNALALVTSSVELVDPAKTLEVGADKDYTIEATASGYTVKFTEAYLKSHIAATEVTVTYSAIVTTDAAYAINPEKNEVQIKYTHDPKSETDYDVKKDSTQHYTFTLDADAVTSHDLYKGKKTSELVKVGLNADGTPYIERTETSAITSSEHWEGPLPGAVFGLFTDAAGTVPYKAKDTDGNIIDQAVTATTQDDGRMTFSGLDAGTYYLKEISAPAGYVTNSDVVKIVIEAEVEEVEVTEQILGKEVTYKTDILKSYSVTVGEGTNATTSTYTFNNDKTPNSNDIQWEECAPIEKPHQFQNVKGVELPSTGGMGTTLLYVGGSILVILAAILLITKRRMSAND